MLLAVDVHYDDLGATVAAVGFTAWTDEAPTFELVLRDDEPPAPYEPGQFFKRELPHVVRIALAARANHVIEAVIIDAHVWLEAGHAGLGKRVHDELGLPVVGVAKTSYKDGIAIAVTRGESKSPLFVTAVGIEVDVAATLVIAMHGEHRLPTLLKRADALARGAAVSMTHAS